jgi:predicted DNA-binding transcriptional regulator AlpA
MSEPITPTSRPDRLLRKPKVLAMLGISHGALYEGMKTGRFPKGYKLSPRVTVWKESEIQALIENLSHESKE